MPLLPALLALVLAAATTPLPPARSPAATPGPSATPAEEPAEEPAATPPEGGSLAPAPTPAVAATPVPGALPHSRERAGLEQRGLQFLVGDWEVAAQWFEGPGATGKAVVGSLSVRFDLAGLLLTERLTLAGRPDAYEARWIWCFDRAAGAFRVFAFDSAGVAGDEFRGAPAAGARVMLERRFSADGVARLERRTFSGENPPAKDGPRRVTLVVEEGEDGKPLYPTLTATLTRSGR